MLIGLGLTWFAHIFEIITYASKAFAFYYALQCAGAFREAKRPMRGVLYGVFCAVAVAILFFGQPVEGSNGPGGS